MISPNRCSPLSTTPNSNSFEIICMIRSRRNSNPLSFSCSPYDLDGSKVTRCHNFKGAPQPRSYFTHSTRSHIHHLPPLYPASSLLPSCAWKVHCIKGSRSPQLMPYQKSVVASRTLKWTWTAMFKLLPPTSLPYLATREEGLKDKRLKRGKICWLRRGPCLLPLAMAMARGLPMDGTGCIIACPDPPFFCWLPHHFLPLFAHYLLLLLPFPDWQVWWSLATELWHCCTM